MQQPHPFGKYYLLERINVGGMAEVFKAKAFGVQGFERLLAVKKILPSIAEDEEFIRMFIDEAKIAVQLNHANIAQIFDLGMVDGSYFIALEYISGKDLRTLFETGRKLRRPVSIPQACFVTLKICEGLDYAHNKRDAQGHQLHIVHRDVSPQNVLISYEGEVKIIDFGIAKAAGRASKTQAGILKGKFGYMSPEQVRGLPLDRRSDIFSVGIILYELLTMERLFVGESDFSTLEKVRNVEILPPTTYNPSIPEALENIVLRSLSRDPDERYQSTAELHDALQHFLFSAGMFYSRTALSAYMKESFDAEIIRELQKLEQYRDLKPPPSSPAGQDVLPPGLGLGTPQPTGRPPQAPPPPPLPAGARLPDLKWEEEEDETTVYDRDPAYQGAIETPLTEDIIWSQPPPQPEDRSLTPELIRMAPAPRSPALFLVAFTAVCLAIAAAVVWVVLTQRSQRSALVLETTPRMVDVHVDGQLLYRGDTPVTLRDLRPGTHQLILRAPEHEDEVRIVNLPRGNSLKMNIQLAKPEVAAGAIHLATTPPGAEVLVNGKPYSGSTPLVVQDLPPGKYGFTLRLEGHEDAELSVQIISGRIVEQSVALRPNPVQLELQSSPPGASFRVHSFDGQLVAQGNTPQRVPDLVPGKTYKIDLRRGGYRPWGRSLTLGTKTEQQLKAHLLPLPRAPPPAPRPPPTPATNDEKEDLPSSEEEELPAEVLPTANERFGYLNLNSKPWAKVYVDGRSLDRETPLVREKLLVGKRRVTLINNRYGIHKDYWVDIRPDRTSTLIVDLQ